MKKLLVVLMVLCFAAPAMAADWHFGGSVRTHLGYYDVDQEFIGGPGLDGTIGSDWDDDSGALLALGSNSNFTARAMVSEKFYGVIQLGFRDTTRANTNNDDDYLRLAYGVWNFGSGKLTVGKDYTPGTYLGYSKMNADIADSADANMLVAGLPYIGRQAQVKLSFGDLDIALIEQHKDANNYGGDVDFVLPRIEAAYVFRTELVNIRPVLGYQSYDIEFDGASDETIDSYLVGIGASFDLKPAYLKATASYIQNSANYGQSNVGVIAFREAVIDATGDVNDSDFMQATLVGGFKVNQMLNIEGGIGYMNSEVDMGPGVTGEQTAMVYYLQGWMSLSKNMHIIPEIGVLDRDELEVKIDGVGTNKTDMGKLTYFDLNFRVEF